MAITSTVAGMNNPVVGVKEMYPPKEQHPECRQFGRPHHPRSGGESCWAGRYPRRSRAVHSICSTNRAFDKLPAGAFGNLLKPEHESLLTKVLTYHVVAGRLSSSDLVKKIRDGNGTAELTTVDGGQLWVMLHDGKHIMLKDEKGGTALVTIANVLQSNGVIHVIDTFAMPN
jgi:hypothetical protein